MLVKMKMQTYDKNDESVVFNAGDVVNVENTERAMAMIENGCAELFEVKVLAEPQTEAPAEEPQEVVNEDAKPTATTRKRKAGAEN